MITKKIPAALFIAAALIAGIAVVRDDDSFTPAAAALPDPDVMRANGFGYQPLDEVAERWRLRVEETPGDYLSRTQYGRSLVALARETGDLALYEQAEAQLARAAAEAPGDVGAQVGYASSLSAQHEFRAALEVLDAAHDLRPTDLGVQAAIADAHLDLGDYDTAFAAFDDLTAQLPDNAATLARQARVAALTGENEDAVELARDALISASGIGMRPSDAAASWFQLGFFQYQAGQVDEAEDSLRSALRVDEGHLGSRELLGKVLVTQGRLDDAATLYEAILVDTPAADLHGLLAEVYEAQGRAEAAAEQVELGLALAADQVGQYPAERRHLAGFFADHDPATFLELMRTDVETRRDIYGVDLLAWALYLNGRVDAARRHIDEALRLGTVDAPMLFHAGMIEIASGDEDAGREHLEQALELNPGFDLGDVELAETTLDEL